MMHGRLRLLPAVGVGAFLVAGLLGPTIAGDRVRETDLSNVLAAPGTDHLFGTDQVGRDVLWRVVAGAYGSAVAVVLSLAGCLLIGAALGLAAGWRGGLLDLAVLRLVDFVSSLPGLLVGLVLAALLGGTAFDVALVMALVSWPPYVRVIRTETRLRRRDPNALTLLMLGAAPARVLVRHVLPGLLLPVAVLMGVTAAQVIIGVATFSYLGLGAQPPSPEWGSMLVDSQPYLTTAPWLFAAPMTVVLLTVMCCNLLADQAGRWFSHGEHPLHAGRAPVRRLAPSPGGTALLQIENLTVDLGSGPSAVRAVDDLSLRVDRGEAVALVGPSGSGKSTTMLSVLRLFPQGVEAHLTGGIHHLGRDLNSLTERQMRTVRGRRIAYVPQDAANALNPLRTVGHQLAGLIRHHHGGTRTAARSKAVALLERVGLPDPRRVARQRPGQLSGGMRQRVVLACALSGDPDLLIADEPTSALDRTSSRAVVELLSTVRRDFGVALLVITHELDVAARLADRIAVMAGGRIVEAGPVADILTRPQHDLTRRLIEAASGTTSPPETTGINDGKPLLDVRLNVRYRARGPQLHAVRDVALQIWPGEVVGIVGDSGCGKSSLARAITGVEPAAHGTVLLDGSPTSLRTGRIRLLFQDPTTALNRRQTISAALLEAAHLTGRRGDDAQREVATSLERVGLTAEHGSRRPWQLSGGERQRAAIARALIGEPDLLILDEPVSSLDSLHRNEIVTVLRRLRDQHDTTVLIIAHDLTLVAGLCDRILVMHDGEIVDQLTAAALTDPAPAGVAAPTRRLLDAHRYFRERARFADGTRLP